MTARGEIIRALRETPRRIADAWRDPLRRRSSLSRIAEGYLGGLTVECAGIHLFLIDDPLAWSALLAHRWGVLATLPLLAPLAEFVFFECLAEPLGWTGAYWERGPRDGERFVRP